jgi:hypothetical protein
MLNAIVPYIKGVHTQNVLLYPPDDFVGSVPSIATNLNIKSNRKSVMATNHLETGIDLAFKICISVSPQTMMSNINIGIISQPRL